MQRKYPHLCAPITLGRTTFRNRMFSAPMGGTDITNDGCIGPKSAAFYELRAKGGAGAVTVSECMVHPATDGSHAYHLDESILNSLACATYTADAIRRHGAKFCRDAGVEMLKFWNGCVLNIISERTSWLSLRRTFDRCIAV